MAVFANGGGWQQAHQRCQLGVAPRIPLAELCQQAQQGLRILQQVLPQRLIEERRA